MSKERKISTIQQPPSSTTHNLNPKVSHLTPSSSHPTPHTSRPSHGPIVQPVLFRVLLRLRVRLHEHSHYPSLAASIALLDFELFVLGTTGLKLAREALLVLVAWLVADLRCSFRWAGGALVGSVVAAAHCWLNAVAEILGGKCGTKVVARLRCCWARMVFWYGGDRSFG